MAFGHTKICQWSLLLYQMDIYSLQSFYSIWYFFFLKYFLSLTYGIKHTSISFDPYYFPSFLYLDIRKIMSLVLFSSSFIHPTHPFGFSYHLYIKIPNWIFCLFLHFLLCINECSSSVQFLKQKLWSHSPKNDSFPTFSLAASAFNISQFCFLFSSTASSQ